MRLKQAKAEAKDEIVAYKEERLTKFNLFNQSVLYPLHVETYGKNSEGSTSSQTRLAMETQQKIKEIETRPPPPSLPTYPSLLFSILFAICFFCTTLTFQKSKKMLILLFRLS